MTVEQVEANGTSGSSNGSNGASPPGGPPPGLWITGIGAQYPPYLYGHELLEDFAKRHYDVENPA